MKRAGSRLWADASKTHRARVVVDLEVWPLLERVAARLLGEAGCSTVEMQGGESFEHCSDGRWRRWGLGSTAELLPDRRTVRTSHAAMQHSVTYETKYERRPGATALLSATDMLVQWSSPSGPHFSLHDSEGGLIAWKVEVPVRGLLIGARGTLVFAHPMEHGTVELTEVRGRLQWRRIE